MKMKIKRGRAPVKAAILSPVAKQMIPVFQRLQKPTGGTHLLDFLNAFNKVIAPKQYALRSMYGGTWTLEDPEENEQQFKASTSLVVELAHLLGNPLLQKAFEAGKAHMKSSLPEGSAKPTTATKKGKAVQAGNVSWHIPAEVEDIFRKAYLRLHKMKHELDQMEEIPKDLQPLYSKILHLADTAGTAVQETAQVTGLVRKLMQHYR